MGAASQTSRSVLPADPAPTTSKLAPTAGIVAAQPVEEAQQFAQQHVRLARTNCDFGGAMATQVYQCLFTDSGVPVAVFRLRAVTNGLEISLPLGYIVGAHHTKGE